MSALSNLFQDIADAIREKTGGTDKMSPATFPQAISDIQAGGGGSVERSPESKPIRFYDPYGNVLYGYTRAEVQELTELPPGPSLSDLTFDKWTHTLDEIKATIYFADVGPMYKYNGTPAAVLILETISASQKITFNLGLSKSDAATIYFGDGASQTVQGSSSVTKSKIIVTHTFSTQGKYIVKIVNTKGSVELGAYNSGMSSFYPAVGISTYNNYGLTNGSAFSGIPDFTLRSVLGCSTVAVTNVFSCQNLRFASDILVQMREYGFLECGMLRCIAGKGFRTWPTMLAGCSVRRLIVPNYSIYKNFALASALEELVYPNSSISEPQMNVQWAMLMTTETPPAIPSTPVWGDKPIYVPDAAVETYKTTDGWSNAAAYIVPASTYPD